MQSALIERSGINAGMHEIRILFLADTHLGFDLPTRPRVERRRRGPDFFDNFERALEPAMEGRVDLVVHGGDLLFRSKVRAELVRMAFEPLHRVTERGVPVYLVPGNHERSAIPFPLLAANPRIHIFRQPDTFVFEKAGMKLALAGFPFTRDDLAGSWTRLLDETGWKNSGGDGTLLCVHQAFEGAKVGPSNYTFRPGAEVVKGREIPEGLLAVLSGHIHRAQILEHDLEGRRMAAPVIYPGSIERTSFAEKDEEKGWYLLTIRKGDNGLRLSGVEFRTLPARPMHVVKISLGSLQQQMAAVDTALEGLPQDSVVQVRIDGFKPGDPVITEARLRSLAPVTMNISLSLPASSREGSPDH